MADSSPRRRYRRIRMLAGLAAGYGLVAYLLFPVLWTQYEREGGIRHLPLVTHTAQGIPGDPLNIGLAGSKADVVRAMHAAGWHPADAITLGSSIGIVESVLLDRPDPDAPVSSLFYEGRREDLAFERPAGRSADRRHHVRFWNVYTRDGSADAVWLGAASFDRGVGISHYTGAVTHDIAPDVDKERDGLTANLAAAGMAAAIMRIAASGPRDGRNGEGDAYFTDGKIVLVRLPAAGTLAGTTPQEIVPTTAITLDSAFWNEVLGP